MRWSEELRAARRRAGLSQRALAERAGTSQATLAAYERARKVPSIEVYERLLAAAGERLTVAARPGRRTPEDLDRSAGRLEDVLILAEALPYRPRPLRFPRLPVS